MHAGSSTIGVTVDGVGPATFGLTVTAVPVASVSVSAPDSSLTTGSTTQATVVARDAANNILPLTGRTIVWTSSATGVATVSSSGLISAVAAGSATIGVTVDGVGPATFGLTVSAPSVASVSVTAPDSNLVEGATTQATVVARDAANNILPLTGRTIVWTSSATGVATVSSSGLDQRGCSWQRDDRCHRRWRRSGDVRADGHCGPRSVGERERSRFEPNDWQHHAGDGRRARRGEQHPAADGAHDRVDQQCHGRGDRLLVGADQCRCSWQRDDRRHRRWRRSGDVPAHGDCRPRGVGERERSRFEPNDGATTQATVVARDAANNILPLTGRTIVWTSSATGVATVSSSGLISAVAAGECDDRCHRGWRRSGDVWADGVACRR